VYAWDIMKPMLLFLVWLVFAIWLWLLLAHGRFWLSGPFLAKDPIPLRPLKVAVIIPARNEAEQIVATLQSLLVQEFAGALKILVVDDNSSDGTGELSRAMAERFPCLHILSGAPLEPGWTGKMWAVAQGLQHPHALEADYVLLTDADILHAPDHIALLTAKAERAQLDLVSEMVRLRCSSFAERAAIPAFVFFFQMLYPFRRVNDSRCNVAAAAGGTMLVSRAALDRTSGVDHIRAALIDDVALARVVKRGGHRIWLGNTDHAESARRYPTLPDIWKMVARTAYVQLNYSPLLLTGTCAALLLIYGLPVLAPLLTTGTVRLAGLGAWLVMALSFQPTLRHYRRSPLWGVALPAIALFYCGATCGSAVSFYRGRGGQWKDRTYPLENRESKSKIRQ
jgi:hopene-associated glycosyltransferase HpnB